MQSSFKYFDLNSNGKCSFVNPAGTVEPEEFAKALEKIGIIFKTQDELNKLFTAYDAD